MVSPIVLSKNFSQFSKVLYHGTTSSKYESLRAGVNISFCEEFTDFGKGFYLTSNFLQASRHADKRSGNKEESIVFVYDLDIQGLKQLYQGYILNKMDVEWAKFIYNNRSRKTNFTHNFDYVLGGVADGAIFDLVKAVDLGLDIKDFYEEIAKYGTYDQLSIHNQDIFKYNVIKYSKVVKAYARNESYDQRRINVISEI
ncbi:DUF3990 domain-containing protein [Lederbergia ruris]|uniref:DUF3990 domain-containing protein n=1 Tax=Lederbergia ruris TaxID=217495 RepID=UPI00130E4B47